MWREFGLIVFISLGIFSNKSNIVHRYITFEKSKMSQIQLATLFNEQADGLVVLKQRPSGDKKPSDKTKNNEDLEMPKL